MVQIVSGEISEQIRNIIAVVYNQLMKTFGSELPGIEYLSTVVQCSLSEMSL